MAVAFTGYRDAYLTAYADAHRARRWQEERRRAEELSRTTTPEVQRVKRQSQTDQAFDQGWKDGFSGKQSRPPWSSDQADAYRNGHRLGTRDREFTRARQLRAEKTRDHSRDR